MKQEKIAIIGAGIGGLTLAALLQKNGFEAHVYEQAQQFTRVGAGIQQSSNSVKVLRELGLEEHLRSCAFQPQNWINREWDSGELKFDLPLGAAFEKEYGAPYLLMHRGDLHAALLSCVRADTISLGKKLTNYELLDNGVRIQFEDGSVQDVDALVGADGVHSQVRELMLGKESPRFTGRVAYRTTFPASLMKGKRVADCTKWWGVDRHIVIYYINPRRDELYFVTSLPEADWSNESWSNKGNLNQLRSAFEGFHQEVQDVLDACPEVHKWALYERDPLPTWTHDRVVLIGDACHPMVPYMAQGAAMAIEDTAILLRHLLDSSDFTQVFKNFQATRMERTSKIQLTSHKNQWMSSRTDPAWVYGYDAWSEALHVA